MIDIQWNIDITDSTKKHERRDIFATNDTQKLAMWTKFRL